MIDVKKIAKLANISLSKNEEKDFKKQLEETLKYVENLNEIDTENTVSTSQVTGLENITREDETAPSLSQQDALKNAKSTHNGFFKVKGILNNE